MSRSQDIQDIREWTDRQTENWQFPCELLSTADVVLNAEREKEAKRFSKMEKYKREEIFTHQY